MQRHPLWLREELMVESEVPQIGDLARLLLPAFRRPLYECFQRSCHRKERQGILGVGEKQMFILEGLRASIKFPGTKVSSGWRAVDTATESLKGFQGYVMEGALCSEPYTIPPQNGSKSPRFTCTLWVAQIVKRTCLLHVLNLNEINEIQGGIMKLNVN